MLAQSQTIRDVSRALPALVADPDVKVPVSRRLLDTQAKELRQQYDNLLPLVDRPGNTLAKAIEKLDPEESPDPYGEAVGALEQAEVYFKHRQERLRHSRDAFFEVGASPSHQVFQPLDRLDNLYTWIVATMQEVRWAVLIAEGSRTKLNPPRAAPSRPRPSGSRLSAKTSRGRTWSAHVPFVAPSQEFRGRHSTPFLPFPAQCRAQCGMFPAVDVRRRTGNRSRATADDRILAGLNLLQQPRDVNPGLADLQFAGHVSVCSFLWAGRTIRVGPATGSARGELRTPLRPRSPAGFVQRGVRVGLHHLAVLTRPSPGFPLPRESLRDRSSLAGVIVEKLRLGVGHLTSA